MTRPREYSPGEKRITTGAFIGDQVIQGGHRYRISAFVETITDSGHRVRRVELQGQCAVCGKPFTQRTSGRINLYLVRTCETHRDLPNRPYRYEPWRQGRAKRQRKEARAQSAAPPTLIAATGTNNAALRAAAEALL